MSNANDLNNKGFKRIAESPNGSVHDCPPNWTGMLAMLLRKIIIDQYDGKGVEGAPQFQSEHMTQARIEGEIEHIANTYFKQPNGKPPTRATINSMKSSLLKEFSRNSLSIKYLGEYFHIIDADFVDFTIVLGRRSGTVKSYTVHVGGLGAESFQRPVYNKQHFDFYKTHEVKHIIEEPSSIEKKLTLKEGNENESE